MLERLEAVAVGAAILMFIAIAVLWFYLICMALFA